MTINAITTNYTDYSMRLDQVSILGVSKPVTSVTVNGKAFSNYLYNFLDGVCIEFYLTIEILSVIKIGFINSWS